MLKIELHKENGLVIIKLSGRFVITETSSFEAVFIKQIELNPSVIAILLREISYIDSSGIGSIIRCMNMAIKKNIEFLCYGAGKDIESIFKLAKIDRFLQLMSEEEFISRYVNSV